MYSSTDTIYAPATPMAKSGVAVVRISGPHCSMVASHFGFEHKFSHGKALFHRLFASSGDLIDEGIVLFFKGPRSFTGEDVLELQLHGSIAVVKRVLTELSQIQGLRMAEPGEFAKRAFLNDKLDLSQAEGLAALIDAETEMQRVVAVRQSMQQQWGVLYEEWRYHLIEITAYMEAFIDFPAEDLPLKALVALEDKISALLEKVQVQLAASNAAKVVRRGIKVAILGAANAGKSSLLNALAKRDVAIVSKRAGTTRDVIELSMDIGGFLFHISDTAGLRETDDEIEREGIKRSLLAFEEADMCLFMVDASSPDLSDEFIERMQSTGKPYILVYNKMDLMPIGAGFVERVRVAAPEALLYISCNEVDVVRRQVIEQLKTFAQEKYTISPESLLISNRDLQLLQEMSGYLGAALIQRDMPMEVRCQYLRMALSCLGNIVGKIDVEEILDSVFGSFCIGK